MNRTEENKEEKEGADDTFSGTFQNEGEHEVRKDWQ
jgi:plastocyanin